MESGTIRFYGSLNDFTPICKSSVNSCQHVLRPNIDSRRSVKDLIESFGVPHCEVDLILVNGISVDFSYIVKKGDYISVYPEFSEFDISTLNKLFHELPEDIKFILDVHLGKLTKYLRLLGIDSKYDNKSTGKELIGLSLIEKRILLTRDVDLLKNSILIHGYWLRNTNPQKQTEEIIGRFNLRCRLKPFSRCLTCNGEIFKIEKELIITKLEPKTKENYQEFYMCNDCKKIYWQGSHWKKMENFVNRFNIS